MNSETGEILLDLEDENEWDTVVANDNIDLRIERNERTKGEQDPMKQTDLVAQITFDIVPNETVTKESIRDFFERFTHVRSVHYYKRQVQGYVKFYEENINMLKRCLDEIVEKKPSIDGFKFSIKIMPQLTFAGNKF